MTTLPSANVLVRAAKIAIDDDRPILLDYFADSVAKTCSIGVRPDGIKYLVKSETEYTSPIQNIFQLEECFIVLTENSIYIVNKDIPRKRVAAATGETPE
jgi:hypothetical protein